MLVGALFRAQRQAGQVEQGQHIREPHLVLQRDGQNVARTHGLARFPREKRNLSLAHSLLGVQPRRVHAFGADALGMVAQPVQDLATQVGHPDRVRVRKGHHDAHRGGFPIPGLNELVELLADVLPRLLDGR